MSRGSFSRKPARGTLSEKWPGTRTARSPSRANRGSGVYTEETGSADQVGHLERWPSHLFRGERERVERAGRGPHMALRQVDVNHGFAQVGVAEQQLDGAQVGARLRSEDPRQHWM